ncbi:MAG: rubisco accessory protein CbbX, ATPase, partial [Pseudomonadota bacterium]
MNAPLYRIPGPSTEAATPAESGATQAEAAPAPRTVAQVLASSQVESVMDELDAELIGLKPVKTRIRD